ncbi:hypothetical protein LCGC14_2915200, partial [marine sediment metagenome]
MSEAMARVFQHLRLNEAACLGLREAVRPFVGPADWPTRAVADFCERLYLAHFSLESDPDCQTVDFPVNQDEIMLINNFVSAEDGDWAKDILHQTRQVLYELTTQKNAMKLAFSSDVKKLFPEESVPTKSEAELTDSTLEDKLKG